MASGFGLFGVRGRCYDIFKVCFLCFFILFFLEIN